MDEPVTQAKRKKPYTRGHISFDPIYMRCQEQANPWEQKVDLWLLQDGGQTELGDMGFLLG